MRRGLVWTVLGSLALAAAARPAVAQAGEPFGPHPAPTQDAESLAAQVEESPAPPVAATETKPLGGGPDPALRSRELLGERAEPPEPAGTLKAGAGWWRTAAALAVVVAIIAACGAGVRAWARRSGGLAHALGAGGRAPSGVLQVLGRYPVGRGQTLVLLKLDRRVLLVSQGSGARAGGMQTLCELTDPEEVASILMLTVEAEGRSLGARFREMVSTFDSTHAQAERVLAPVVIERARAHPAPGMPDPLGRLRSRLDSLRDAEPGAPA